MTWNGFMRPCFALAASNTLPPRASVAVKEIFKVAVKEIFKM
jgi:hypothetical protein